MKESENKDKTNFLGYPPYPKKEDIYIQSDEETEIDPEDISKVKLETVSDDTQTEVDSLDEVEGDVLDVPGSELDDVQEEIGSEDEENNYYSIGGDNHDD